jgi:type I restriction enzyme S subunit
MTRKLKDVCELITDCEHKTALTQQIGYPSIRTPNIGKGRLILDNVNRVSEETYKAWTQREIPKTGDLILAREAPIGNVAIIPENLKVCLGQRTVLIRANKNFVDPDYLLYLLLGDEIQGKILSVANGATVHHLNMSDIRNLILPELPLLPTQRKIAAILSAYDDLIENNTRRIKILEEMAQILYREWFVRFRFPGHEKVQMVDSSQGEIPDEWWVSNLESVCRRITDGSHWSPQSVLEGYPMASVKDMHNWGFDIENCRRIGEDDYVELVRNDCKPLKHDVLIAKDGSYLKHIFVANEELDMVILSSIAILRTNDQMNPFLLAMYLKEPSVMARMKGYVSGVAVPRIVLKDFRKFEIVIPPKQLQEAWWKIAEPLINHCLCLIEKNANLRCTRDLLLPKLISGEINVTRLEIKMDVLNHG